VSLVLHDPATGADEEVPMNRSGEVWHVALEGLPRSGVLYGFRVHGDGGWETGYRWADGRDGSMLLSEDGSSVMTALLCAVVEGSPPPQTHRLTRPCLSLSPHPPPRWDAKRILLDPRAPLVAGRSKWCQREALERFTLDVRRGGGGERGATWPFLREIAKRSNTLPPPTHRTLNPFPLSPLHNTPLIARPAEGQRVVGHL
jgi:hypothetical protein